MYARVGGSLCEENARNIMVGDESMRDSVDDGERVTGRSHSHGK